MTCFPRRLPLVQMKHVSTLTTSGYELRLYIAASDKSLDYARIVAEFISHPDHSLISVKSRPNSILVKDLEKLVRCFENHLYLIKNNLGNASFDFLSYCCSFRIGGRQGEIRSEFEGEFTIQCLVNAGEPNDSQFSTYLGGEAVVTLGSANEFMNSLREVVSTIASLNKTSL